MRKLLIACLLMLPLKADATVLQLGADAEVPYRLSDPSGRSAALFGAHAELFLHPQLSLGAEAIFGVEKQEFHDYPIIVAPGATFYSHPGVLEPYLRFDVPIRMNTANDAGVRGGLGLMLDLGLLGLKYDADVTYWLDNSTTTFTIAHLSAVLQF